MSYVAIKDFQRGLDARKFKLSQPAGTLIKAVNGHITPGGEFEKRKAFALILSGGQSQTLPAGTFGIQEAQAGIYVFGSKSAGSLAFAVSAPFIYQRLQHPAVSDGFVADGAGYAMTGVSHSSVFGGYPFVIATFADGNSFAFYNGYLCRDFVAGQVWPWMVGASLIGANTIENLAIDFKNAAQDEPGGQTNDYTGSHTAGSGRSDVQSTPGVDFTAAMTLTPASGTLGTQAVGVYPLYSSIAPVTATGASGSFAINACNSGGGSLTAVKVNGANQLSASIAAAATPSAMAGTVAANINGNAAATCSATASGNLITLTLKAAGSAGNGFLIQTTVTGNVAIGIGVMGLQFVSGTTSITPSTDLTSAIFTAVIGGTSLFGSAASTWYTGLSSAITDLTVLARDIANAITANVGSNGGYVAASSGVNVIVSKQTTTSNDPSVSITISNTSTKLVINNNTNATAPANPPQISSSLSATVKALASETRLYNDYSSKTIYSITSLGLTIQAFAAWATYPAIDASQFVSGGTAPYTYSWTITSKIGGGNYKFSDSGTATSASAKTSLMYYNKPFVLSGSTIVGGFLTQVQLTVTDALGATAVAIIGFY